MKKLIFALALLIVMTIQLPAQFTNFKPGNVEFAAGIGVLPTYFKDKATTVVPPVSARLDVRVTPGFTLGAFAGYSSYTKEKLSAPSGAVTHIENESLMIGLRAAMHALRVTNTDIYGGFQLGYEIPNVNTVATQVPTDSPRDDIQPSFSRPAENKLVYSGFIGASHYLTKRVGFYGEVGFGISVLNVGLTWKLK
ncbi:MAG TPA: hypothetical protein PKE06_20835 [Flavilitoribacter sp.]|nr:hypothetical protein [Flavilitoribacter sp.]HMQ88128.1 hypothetical protein [Flavilitoribacter sp.]